MLDSAGVIGGGGDARRQLADLEQLIDGGVWELEVASGTVDWSAGLCRLYGVEPSGFEATYENWFAMVHPDDREMVGSTVSQAIERVTGYRFEHRLHRASDGAERWTRCMGRVFAGADGGAQRVFGVSIDITEEQHAHRVVQELIANAAHELRTPAAAIGQAVSALRGELDDEDRAQVLDVLVRQSARLKTLTTNLVDLGAIEVAPTAALLEPVEVAAALDDAVHATPVPEGRRLDRTGVPAGLRAWADPSHLERVLINLLTNAWRYGGPTVTVVAAGGDEVAITVSDDGDGVPESIRAHLFEPFRRGPQRHPEASGLGLAIVDGLVRRMGGSVAYLPERPGAAFVVTLDPA